VNLLLRRRVVVRDVLRCGDVVIESLTDVICDVVRNGVVMKLSLESICEACIMAMRYYCVMASLLVWCLASWRYDVLRPGIVHHDIGASKHLGILHFASWHHGDEVSLCHDIIIGLISCVVAS